MQRLHKAVESRESRGRTKSQNLKSRARDYDHTHERAQGYGDTVIAVLIAIEGTRGTVISATLAVGEKSCAEELFLLRELRAYRWVRRLQTVCLAGVSRVYSVLS